MSREVTVGCPCPGQPHESDTVGLRETLDLATGIAMQNLVAGTADASGGLSTAEAYGVLAEAYLLFGVESWSFVNEAGSLIPVNRDTIRIRLLSDFSLAAPVAEAADELYTKVVILPLVERARRFSPTTPTASSTSASPPGTSLPPRRSRRSSTSTSPTGDTDPTSASPAGVSSSSPS